MAKGQRRSNGLDPSNIFQQWISTSSTLSQTEVSPHPRVTWSFWVLPSCGCLIIHYTLLSQNQNQN